MIPQNVYNSHACRRAANSPSPCLITIGIEHAFRLFSLSLQRDKLYKFHPRGQSTINHFPTAAEQLTVIGLVDA